MITHKHNFRVGDRILCTGIAEGNSNLKNKTGTVICNLTTGLTIEFDNKFPGGHTGPDYNGKKGHCWNVYKDIKMIK